MSETPQPRPRRGVLGYAAELQQFEPVPAYVYDLAAPAPATTILPAPPPPPLAPARPRASTVTIVSHIRQRPQRRMRAVLAGAAALILAGAGLAYAGLGGPDGAPRAAPGAVQAGGPADELLPLDSALPGADPVTGRPGTPAPTSTGVTAGGGATGSGRSPGGAGLPVVPVLPGRTDPLDSAPVATTAPTAPGDLATTAPPVAPAVPLALAATFSHVVDAAEDGFLGYAGTVRLDNPGSRDVTGWRVTLTVPGGNPVTAAGASVAQDGETVTFTPDGDATVPAGGAVTFSFEVAGRLTALPGGCAVDGVACA